MKAEERTRLIIASGPRIIPTNLFHGDQVWFHFPVLSGTHNAIFNINLFERAQNSLSDRHYLRAVLPLLHWRVKGAGTQENEG